MKIEQFHQAANLIEQEGVSGFDAAKSVSDENTAKALLIAHLRRQVGSTETFPADASIEEQVFEILKENNLDHLFSE